MSDFSQILTREAGNLQNCNLARYSLILMWHDTVSHFVILVVSSIDRPLDKLQHFEKDQKRGVWVIVEGRVSRVRGRGSRVASRGSKSRGRGSKSRGRGSKSRGRGSKSRGRRFKSRGRGSKSRGRGSKSRGRGSKV